MPPFLAQQQVHWGGRETRWGTGAKDQEQVGRLIARLVINRGTLSRERPTRPSSLQHGQREQQQKERPPCTCMLCFGTDGLTRNYFSCSGLQELDCRQYRQHFVRHMGGMFIHTYIQTEQQKTTTKKVRTLNRMEREMIPVSLSPEIINSRIHRRLAKSR